MNKCLNCGKETNNNKFCSISCQNKSQGKERADKRYGLLKKFTVKCCKCEKEIIIEEREKLFPQREKYYCSRNCANSREHSDETKEKIKNTLLSKSKKIKKQFIKNPNVKIICKNCGKEFEVKYGKRKQIFCSISCSFSWRNKYEGLGRKAGLASVKSQAETKRSKNEIYFSELCKLNFKEVLTNESIFNGWDADVIIEDFKIAILWNGKWHYEKIKEKHSVEQVQNRDKIKIKEIEKMNYKTYIIKDMGKYKKEFVENEFNKFLLFLVTHWGFEPQTCHRK